LDFSRKYRPLTEVIDSIGKDFVGATVFIGTVVATRDTKISSRKDQASRPLLRENETHLFRVEVALAGAPTSLFLVRSYTASCGIDFQKGETWFFAGSSIFGDSQRLMASDGKRDSAAFDWLVTGAAALDIPQFVDWVARKRAQP
jgi:hypothetical protein